VRVLVLHYDPLVPSMGGVPLHEALGFDDPARLTLGYIQDLEAATSGRVQHTIVEWRDLDEFPVKIDGFRYTVSEYIANWQSGSGWHSPDTMDYVAELEAKGVPAMINADEIDEVWFFGAPYFGYWEAAMAGPGAFFINGGVYPQIQTSRPFAIMGFNYERGVAEMLHSLGHRAENHLARVFGGWNLVDPVTDWDHFSANVGQSNGTPGVGNIHYPANGHHDYEYGNPTPVLSTALDWALYPDLTGATTMISAASWTGSENLHRGYMKFWFELLPHAPGLHPVHGRANDWYAYIYDWLRYDGDGQPVYGHPQSYCETLPNSTGFPSTISWMGSGSLTANDLVLVAELCPPDKSGLFFLGDLQGQLPFGDGIRCVFGSLARLPVLTTDGAGVATYAVDNGALPGGMAVTLGTELYFQFWFRDGMGPGGSGFNTSDGLHVTFGP